MTDRDDHRLVELLFDEVPPDEAGALRDALRQDDEEASDLASLQATLEFVRSVPPEDAPDFLDAKVMAVAREVADQQVGGWRKWRRRLLAPGLGLAVPEIKAN
ncbi:MAG: hypothetical protein AAF449_22420, partial [Myxococcota bacterium]